MVLAKHDFIMVPFLEVRETMDLLTPSLVGIGLSMDCFAVSLALGSTIKTPAFIRSTPDSTLFWCIPGRHDPDRMGSRCLGNHADLFI